MSVVLSLPFFQKQDDRFLNRESLVGQNKKGETSLNSGAQCHSQNIERLRRSRDTLDLRRFWKSLEKVYISRLKKNLTPLQLPSRYLRDYRFGHLNKRLHIWASAPSETPSVWLLPPPSHKGCVDRGSPRELSVINNPYLFDRRFLVFCTSGTDICQGFVEDFKTHTVFHVCWKTSLVLYRPRPKYQLPTPLMSLPVEARRKGPWNFHPV